MSKVKMPKSQIICFVLIIIVCIVAIMEALYYVMNPTSLEKENVASNSIDNNTLANTNLVDDFDNIFLNTLKNTNNSDAAEKIDSSKDYVYTDYEKKEVNSGNYDVDVNIPKININSEEVKSYNDSINQIFIRKADSILNGGANKSIYSVDYEAYLNNNILSVVIKATIKEGDTPQRVIIQTYCYNIKDMKKVNFSDLMQLKYLDTNTVQERIKKQVQGKQEEAKALQQLGYSSYIRDLRSDRYDVENITNFFIDDNNNIYVIFAYGNNTNTDATDIITF